MITIAVDSKDMENQMRWLAETVKGMRDQLPYMVLMEGKNSLMAWIRTMCPTGTKFAGIQGMKKKAAARKVKGIDIRERAMGRKVSSRGHLKQYLTGEVVKYATGNAMLRVWQSGNFNAQGKPYLNWVIEGTKPSKGRFVPVGSGFRMSERKRRGQRAAVTKAKMRYGRHWRRHVSTKTTTGAGANIGMHPGNKPNPFHERAYLRWVRAGEHYRALNTVLRRIWGVGKRIRVVAGKLGHPKAAKAQLAQYRATQAAAAAERHVERGRLTGRI